MSFISRIFSSCLTWQGIDACSDISGGSSVFSKQITIVKAPVPLLDIYNSGWRREAHVHPRHSQNSACSLPQFRTISGSVGHSSTFTFGPNRYSLKPEKPINNIALSLGQHANRNELLNNLFSAPESLSRADKLGKCTNNQSDIMYQSSESDISREIVELKHSSTETRENKTDELLKFLALEIRQNRIWNLDGHELIPHLLCHMPWWPKKLDLFRLNSSESGSVFDYIENNFEEKTAEHAIVVELKNAHYNYISKNGEDIVVPGDGNCFYSSLLEGFSDYKDLISSDSQGIATLNCDYLKPEEKVVFLRGMIADCFENPSEQMVAAFNVLHGVEIVGERYNKNKKRLV